MTRPEVTITITVTLNHDQQESILDAIAAFVNSAEPEDQARWQDCRPLRLAIERARHFARVKA